MHAITIREDNKAEFAFTGSRSAIWHGLGNELSDNASIDTWKREAGMDWEAMPSPVTYSAFTSQGLKECTFKGKKVLFRSDTSSPLSIVSDDYKVVQPGEILEFFNDVALENKMKLSTAGTLFGGKRFWALAEMNKENEIVKGDKIKAHLLLVTSVDGTLATTAKFTSTRVVCNNTLTVAMNEHDSKMFKKSHRTTWDAKEAKINLDLVDESWDSFITSMKKLAEVEVTDLDARKFFETNLFIPGVPEENQGWGAVGKVEKLMHLYKNGAGSEFSYGTAYGLLNAVTEAGTHGTGRAGSSQQFWNSYFGQSDKFKTDVLSQLLTTAGLEV